MIGDAVLAFAIGFLAGWLIISMVKVALSMRKGRK